MKIYHPNNQNTFVDIYNEGQTSITTNVPKEKNEELAKLLKTLEINSLAQPKELIVQILDSISPKGHIDVIHSKSMTFEIEGGANWRTPPREIFFITKHENKTNFFLYEFFAGNDKDVKKIYNEQITELNKTDFFKKLEIQPELKELHDSFYKNLSILNLHSNLNNKLEDKTTSLSVKKI